MFKPLERTFQPLECTFQPLERKMYRRMDIFSQGRKGKEEHKEGKKNVRKLKEERKEGKGGQDSNRLAPPFIFISCLKESYSLDQDRFTFDDVDVLLILVYAATGQVVNCIVLRFMLMEKSYRTAIKSYSFKFRSFLNFFDLPDFLVFPA